MNLIEMTKHKPKKFMFGRIKSVYLKLFATERPSSSQKHYLIIGVVLLRKSVSTNQSLFWLFGNIL